MNHLDEYIVYMTANIPNDILRYGFYDVGETFGYYNIPIPEYAIKQEEMNPKYIVEVNSFVKHEYKNQNEEYQKYLELMKKLSQQYGYDFSKIVEYLESCNLEELLGVKDDDRTEDEILSDHLKQLSKIFPLYD